MNISFLFCLDSQLVRVRSMSDSTSTKPSEAVAASKHGNSRARSHSRPISIGSIKIRNRSTEETSPDRPVVRSLENNFNYLDQNGSKKNKGKQKGLPSLSAFFSKGSKNVSITGKSHHSAKKYSPIDQVAENPLHYPSIIQIYTGINTTDGSRSEPLIISSRMNANKVIEEAIHTLKLDNTDPQCYALCEMIYHAKDRKANRRFSRGSSISKADLSQPIYLRIIPENEQPLALQTFWQVVPDYERRYELLWKTDALSRQAEFQSSTTMEDLRRKLCKNGIPNDELADSSSSITQQQQEQDQLNHESIYVDHIKSDGESSSSSPRKLSKLSVQSPHFVKLRGFELKEEHYVYNLIERETLVSFRYIDDCETDNEILLRSPDILPQHCWIYNRVVSEDKSEVNFYLTLYSHSYSH